MKTHKGMKVIDKNTVWPDPLPMTPEVERTAREAARSIVKRTIKEAKRCQ